MKLQKTFIKSFDTKTRNLCLNLHLSEVDLTLNKFLKFKTFKTL
jgi:hypothetical protein